MPRLALVRFLPALCLSASLAGQSGRQEQAQLDASPTLFAVLAAVNAAGYDAELNSPSNHPLRQAVRAEIARRKPSSVQDIRLFMAKHRQEDAIWELRQYISYALLVDEPPSFKFRLLRHQLPPDVAAMEDFAPLLARFYSEAGIADLWRRAQPAFEEAIARYHEPASRALLEANAYLRNPTTGGPLGRRFQIYLDLLGAPNQIHFRSFLDDYFVVLTASAEPKFNEIREAYLHFLLDPMATRYAGVLEEKKAVGDYALGAPFLPDHFKQDFLLLATRCLVRAVESRLLRGGPQKRQDYVSQAMKEGFILTAHFAEQLPAYEKQEQFMRFYFPELVKSIDLKREEARLESFEFAAERRLRLVKPPPPPPPPPLSGAAKTLEEAEQLYTDRELDGSREAYMKALQQTEEKSLHAKAYYGLARIAALRREPELAEKLFQKALELGPEAQVRAWALVYLGRLADLAGERQEAAGYYRAALAVEGASAAARQAAETGLKQSFGKEK